MLPDAWLRVAFAEMNDLPASGAKRDEVAALEAQAGGPVPGRGASRRGGIEVTRLPAQDRGSAAHARLRIDATLRQARGRLRGVRSEESGAFSTPAWRWSTRCAK